MVDILDSANKITDDAVSTPPAAGQGAQASDPQASQDSPQDDVADVAKDVRKDAPSILQYVEDLEKAVPALDGVAEKVNPPEVLAVDPQATPASVPGSIVVPEANPVSDAPAAEPPPPPPAQASHKNRGPKGLVIGLVALFFIATTGLVFVFVNQQQSLNDLRNQAVNSLYPPIYNSCITLCQGNQTCITTQCLPLLNPTPTTVDPKTRACGNQMPCPDGWACTGSTIPGTSGSFTLKYCKATTAIQCNTSGACPTGYSCTGPQVPGTLNSYCMLNTPTPVAGSCPNPGDEYSVKAKKCITPIGDCGANTSGVAASIGVCCVPAGGTSYNDGTGNYNPTTEPIGGPFTGTHWTTCAAGYTCQQTKGCFKTGGGGGGTTGTPPPGNEKTPTPTRSNTPTPTRIVAQCNDIKVYKNGVVVVPSTLKPGDAVTIAVTGGNATKARIRVNGSAWSETSTKNASGEYTLAYTIPTGVTNFTIESEIYGLDGAWH